MKAKYRKRLDSVVWLGYDEFNGARAVKALEAMLTSNRFGPDAYNIQPNTAEPLVARLNVEFQRFSDRYETD